MLLAVRELKSEVKSNLISAVLSMNSNIDNYDDIDNNVINCIVAYYFKLVICSVQVQRK